MCGITGFASLDLASPAARELGETLTSAIYHRGPDGGGVATHPDATLGMRRLAIVDIVHGHQPMFSDDDQIALVYNGEIYNAPQLRASMEREGVRFRTRSDTEVILRRYEHSPETLESELAGMWAFAIHDRRRKRLLLSRDRFGIKPLFIADTGTAIAFASELKAFAALRTHPQFAPLFEVDRGAAHAMLSWGYVPECDTIYRGVRRLEPGTRLEIDLSTRARRPSRYYTLAPNREAAAITTLPDACTLVESVLRRSVREHLESDVPVASFLSGGIDSSLITALAHESSAQPIHAFTIGFREARFDESAHARATADRLGVPIHIEYLDPDAARTALPDALIAYDEPFGDSAGIPTLLLSRVVARTHKVALGGDGGDEVFAGYNKNRILPLRARLSRAPALRDALARALTRLPGTSDRGHVWTDAIRIARRAGRGLEGNDAESYVRLSQFTALAETAHLVNAPVDPARFEAPAFSRFREAGASTLERTLRCDLGSPLANDMLTKVDRASMSCHLEARVPFLDHRLVEIGVSLPERFTLGRNGKAVLRAIHERRFGKDLARRPKQGFDVPVEAWLRGPLVPACDRLFERRRLERYGLLSPTALSEGRWRDHVRIHPLMIWNAFALAAWCEITLGPGPDELRSILHP